LKKIIESSLVQWGRGRNFISFLLVFIMPPKSRKKNATPLNIMVTGFSGVGKTAFVRTLCETLTDLDTEPIPEMTGPLSKTEKPYPVSLDFDYEGERIALTVIDTPGFQVNTSIEKSLQEITEYIEQQFDLAIAEVSSTRGACGM
jgi:cell division control protein 11